MLNFPKSPLVGSYVTISKSGTFCPSFTEAVIVSAMLLSLRAEVNCRSGAGRGRRRSVRRSRRSGRPPRSRGAPPARRPVSPPPRAVARRRRSRCRTRCRRGDGAARGWRPSARACPAARPDARRRCRPARPGVCRPSPPRRLGRPRRHRRDHLLRARRPAPRARGRHDHPDHQPPRPRLPPRDHHPGLAHEGSRLVRLEPSRQEPVRDDQPAVRHAGAVARSRHPGHARRGAAQGPPDPARRADHPQGIPPARRLVLRVPRGRPSDDDRTRRLSEGARAHARVPGGARDGLLRRVVGARRAQGRLRRAGRRGRRAWHRRRRVAGQGVGGHERCGREAGPVRGPPRVAGIAVARKNHQGGRMATQARTRKHADDDKRSGPRPMWKGAVTFGLVTVPVALHPATERKNELSFRLLHARDESPIDYKRVCHEEGVEVPWAEIVKGYALAKDRYVVVSDEDFEKARVRGTQTFEIRDFVPGTSIDDFYFTQPYYVAPAGPAAAKPYALLRDALAQSGRVGIGTIVLRQREHLAALEPAGQALLLTTLRRAYELRAPSSLGLPSPTTPRDRRALA